MSEEDIEQEIFWINNFVNKAKEGTARDPDYSWCIDTLYTFINLFTVLLSAKSLSDDEAMHFRVQEQLLELFKTAEGNVERVLVSVTKRYLETKAFSVSIDDELHLAMAALDYRTLLNVSSVGQWAKACEMSEAFLRKMRK